MTFQVPEVLLGNISGKDNDQIIEIIVKEDENIFEIRLLGYGEGLGWYVQKLSLLVFLKQMRSYRFFQKYILRLQRN